MSQEQHEDLLALGLQSLKNGEVAMALQLQAILQGASSALDIGAVVAKHRRLDVMLDDEKALKQDWEAVGNDIRSAMCSYERDHRERP